MKFPFPPLNICPYANKKVFYKIFLSQEYVASLEKYFSKNDSLRSATTVVPRKFLLFFANNYSLQG